MVLMEIFEGTGDAGWRRRNCQEDKVFREWMKFLVRAAAPFFGCGGEGMSAIEGTLWRKR